MRAGETDGRHLDCTPALAPVGDTFSGIPTLIITRIDVAAIGVNDLSSAGNAWADEIDETNRIPTYGFNAGTSVATYLLRISSDTAQGRTFIRDWKMSVLPALG